MRNSCHEAAVLAYRQMGHHSFRGPAGSAGYRRAAGPPGPMAVQWHYDWRCVDTRPIPHAESDACARPPVDPGVYTLHVLAYDADAGIRHAAGIPARRWPLPGGNLRLDHPAAWLPADQLAASSPGRRASGGTFAMAHDRRLHPHL